MCGIFGFNFENKELLRKGTAVLAHRGPDDSGYFTDVNVSLGHRRLSIIDLRKKGMQPMCDAQGEIWITYNGEIYNYKEIRQRLEKKYDFKSNTDTEVILYAYKEYGERCVEHFNGMFAFCIYDRRSKKFFLARDRIGIKPLYYYSQDGKFIFSSEIKAIVQDTEVKRMVNSRVLAEYFAYSFPISDETIFAGIKELLPGHYLILTKNEMIVRRYWQVRENSSAKNLEYYAFSSN